MPGHWAGNIQRYVYPGPLTTEIVRRFSRYQSELAGTIREDLPEKAPPAREPITT